MIFRLLAFTFCFVLGLESTFASDGEITNLSLSQHPAIQNPTWMKDAVQVRISRRGQRLFADQLLAILSNLGVVIDENYFPSFDFVSDEPIRIDELAKKQPEEFEMLLKVRQFFKQYLQGIEFKDFRPSIQIGESGYKAEFQNLSIVTDENLMKTLGKTEGAVLAIKMVVTSLKAHTDGSIKFKDLENPWIGEIGIVSPEVLMASPEVPLTATMPFYIRVNAQGLLEFEALSLTENIDKVDIEVKYQKIILPEYEFKVVGQDQTYKIKLNDTEFKKIVDENLPDGLKMIRKYLRDFLQNELPKIFNKQAQESLKEKLEQVQPVPAPNKNPNDPRPDFSLGLRLSNINLVDSQWAIGLSAFIEDTTHMVSTPFWERSGARGTPLFNHMDPDKYDLAIAVDRAVFNRAIHLATNRKNFKKLETCPGQPTIELLSGPAIDFNPNGGAMGDLEAPLSMYIDALVDVPEEQQKKFGIPILKDKLHLTMRFGAIIKPAAPGSAKLSIFPTGADLKTLEIDRDSLRGIGKLFEGKVRSEIEKILSTGTNCGNKEPLANFELINSLWGIELEYAKIRMDSQGQLMLYMNYKKKVNPGHINGDRK